MECTPPLSPSRDAGDNSFNVLQQKGNIGFHCITEASKRAPFDIDGFLRNGEGDLSESAASDRRLNCSFLKVFDELYDIDSTCTQNLDRLFKIARNRICLLEAAQKANKGTYGLLTGVNDIENLADFSQTRRELREFYFMLRILINVQSSEDDCTWVLDKLVPTITRGLSLLRSQLGWLSELPSYVLSYAHIRSATKSTAQVPFHLFHCHLELRWLHISVLYTFFCCMNVSSRFEASQVTEILQTGTSDSFAQKLQSAIELCLCDLIEMAVSKFNKLNQDKIVDTPLFNCKCVKELWLLLRLVTEKYNNHNPKSFWKLIDSFLDMLVKDRDNTNISRGARRPLVPPTHISCSDPSLFSLWLLKSVGELYTYNMDGYPCTSNECDIESGQLTLKRLLSNVGRSSDMDEPQRRVLVNLVNCLTADPWKPKPEPIMMLWEGFSSKLDSAFQIPGAPTSSFSIASETIQDILNSITYEGILSKPGKANSFDMFLILLGKFLKHDPAQWKTKMSGRFCSKLSEKKVDGLSEMGLYHLCQLILTIASKTDLDDLASRFQKWVRFSDSGEKRNVMVMKAQLCFVCLFAREGKPLAPLLSPLIEKLDSFLALNQTAVAHAFVANFQHILSCSENLPPDLHAVCGEWINNFLKNNHDSARNLLNVMTSIMQKVQIYLDSSNTVGIEIESLLSALREHLLPYVKENKKTPVEQVADLAVSFTLTASESSSGKDTFQNLLVHFLASEVSHVLFLRRYLFRILTCGKIRDIVEGNEKYQVLFIQAWIRCCTLNSSWDQIQDNQVAQQIFAMPLLKDIVSVDNLQYPEDPLVDLIESYGRSNLENKKTFLVLIEPLKSLMTIIKSSLFPSKPKDSSWKSEKGPQLAKDVTVRAFYIFGKLTCDCSAFVYEKNTSTNFLTVLINTLILPPVVLDANIRLPLPMDEGLRKSVHLYLRGLHNLDPGKERCIQRFLSNIIETYVPRFGVIPQNDPFLKIWDDPEYMTHATYVIQLVCVTLLQWDTKTNSPHKYYLQGLNLINELIKRNEYDDMLFAVIIENVFPACLNVVARISGNMGASGSIKRKETEKTFKLLFDAEAYHTNPDLWDQTSSALNNLSNSHLSCRAEIFFRMLYFLMREFRLIVKRFLPTLKANIKSVIAKRGSGSDKFLETNLARLEASVASLS